MSETGDSGNYWHGCGGGAVAVKGSVSSISPGGFPVLLPLPQVRRTCQQSILDTLSSLYLW